MKLTSLFIFCIALTAEVNAQISISLTPTNISCFGGRNGAVSSSVSGGTSPYTYLWSTGATTSSLSTLAAGYYAVTVTDANSVITSRNVTLTEPTALSLTLTPSVYNTVNNISCPNCCNGYINISVGGGVTSYSYVWSSSVAGYSSASANISNLCKGIYSITVTDARGCTITDVKTMSEPDKDSWTMTGNSASSASTNFIGTIDSVDFILRTKNTERFRIKANGDLKIPGLAPASGYREVGIDSTGKLIASAFLTPWYVNGNTAIVDTANFIGTLNPADLVFKTTAFTSPPGLKEHMRITKDGQVLIGAVSGDQKLTVAHSDTNGGIALNRLSAFSGKNEIRFEQNGTEKWAIGNDLDGTGQQTFFIWDHVYGGSRFFINQDGKVGIGVNPPADTTGNEIYKLYVGGGIMARDVKVTATNPFPDYVFNTGYKPLSIYELEQFIKQNKRLPGIPSAKEIEKNEGYELGGMVQKLLEKTEEQSLYIIDLQKQVDELKAQMKNNERRK
jgi:SprB-like repeat protein